MKAVCLLFVFEIPLPWLRFWHILSDRFQSPVEFSSWIDTFYLRKPDCRVNEIPILAYPFCRVEKIHSAKTDRMRIFSCCVRARKMYRVLRRQGYTIALRQKQIQKKKQIWSHHDHYKKQCPKNHKVLKTIIKNNNLR